MKLAFIFVGGHKESWLIERGESYQKKIDYFFKTDILRLKPSQIARDSAELKLQQECRAILEQIQPQDFVVLCDERGKSLSSKKFSEQFVKWCESQKSRIVFVIGGAFGANEELKKRSNYQLSLSELTFNHHLAQLVILEQVYRGISIWKNLPYHNDSPQM